MTIDITSFFFNSSIEGATATSAWGTSIGQSKSKECRIEDEKPGVLELLTGMLYKSIADKSRVDLSGGSQNREVLLCSLFDKIYINNQPLEGQSFALILVRERSKSHDGRLLISYPPYALVDGQPINQSAIEAMSAKIGCSSNGCWFVHDISIRNQDELHFSSIVVDKDKPKIYTGTSKQRSKEWNNLVEIKLEYTLKELGAILKDMYDNAESGKQVAMIYIFVFKYGEYLVDIYKSSEIIAAAGLPASYSTEVDKAYSIYRFASKKRYLLPGQSLKSSAHLPNSEQTIYYGSPGTGKSHTVEKFIKEIKEKNPSITDYRTTFHPDYDYASFVGSYKPVVKQDSLHKGKKYTEDELADIYVKNVVPAENSSIGFVEQRIKFGVDYCEYFNGDIAEYDINHILELAGKEVEAGSKNRVGFTYVQYGVKIGPDTRRLVNESTITYEFVPQVFTKAYVDAWNKLEEGTPVYLVIEEINRGNCAQIFGDIFQLLDRKDDGYSKYPVVPDTDLKDYLTGLENWGKTHPGIANGLCLPPNLNIIATMNTSDQSLFPMDSAFKRRWNWKFIPIDPDCPDSQFKITIGEKHFSWASFITKVNQRILNLTESEDKQIGNFFIKKDIDADEFRSKVMFYLWNDVCKEHYNAGSFFKYTSGEDGEKEFTFNQLFAGDATCILQGFMEYLEVEEK